MKLYEKPCSSVLVGRRRYPLHLTHDRVLFALDAVQDPLLTDADKLRLVLGLLLRKRVPASVRLQEMLLDAIMAEIAPQENAQDGPQLLSLSQDAALIHAAFRQTYGIDLHHVSLPWETFCELLSGLPENTRLCEVIALRAKPIPAPDGRNSRYIDELLRAKAAVALDIPPAQQKTSFCAGLNHFARSMIAWAEQNAERR